MLSNKRYLGTSLATQMILIPFLLTIGMIIVSSITDGLRLYELGKDAKNLILLSIAFFGSLIIGIIVGYSFVKLSKHKPNSAKERYLIALVPILYALVFAILALSLSNGNFNSGWWGMYALKNPMFLIFGIGLSLSGLHFIIPVAELMGYMGFLIGIVLCEWAAKTAVDSSLSRNFKAVLVLLCIFVLAFSGVATTKVIDNGMTELLYGKSTVGSDLTEFDLMEKAPFKDNNGLAKLDKPANLQFSEFDSMPRLDGATAAYPVYAAFVEAVYTGLGEYYIANKNNNDKEIYPAFVASERFPLDLVKCSKTGTAYERLIAGQTDIIFVAEPSKAHVEEIKAKGDEFVLTPIGSEAFVFFTNSKNPVENLTIKQIQDIYSGKITRWKEVGGQWNKILPYQRPENSGSQTVMQNKVMKGITMLEQTKETYAGGMGEIISQVASYKNAKNSIGYSFMYYSTEMIKNNQIKYLAIDGIKPTPETVRNKTYPFTVPVYAVSLKSNKKENVSRFLDWILSEEGQSLIEKTGYVPAK
ncbi:substrate-binding domain-containing protein [Desulfosporosinus sp. BICA1-9]|uniref:substrate-binding domain-containing protein n=1 Tax=Desulfosporosinus sp. BICA1-9 TaxID=1531958 RepID=UPI00054B8D86|nr:substrate-binding domain-containing protein [Desulfosporosinus sp. BICA1-9]KJS48337.1 MAG: phosphate ABC transporter substrate-binding protein [Peptococcaceae bacterium BRH_c23]KJS85794.1 MAG: phosphate ABC transporter substrate-binding protein [Desulfosporosinus sp. BICA1-9]HBW34968.1 phosphate ABC transporter substrate-binding protein [Desulfosporosinus sp.]